LRFSQFIRVHVVRIALIVSNLKSDSEIRT